MRRLVRVMRFTAQKCNVQDAWGMMHDGPKAA